MSTVGGKSPSIWDIANSVQDIIDALNDMIDLQAAHTKHLIELQEVIILMEKTLNKMDMKKQT